MPDNSPTAIVRLFSWLRQGLHASITAGSTSIDDGHLSVPMRLRVNGGNDLDVPVQLYAPGDVTGIDPRAVIRTEPEPFSADFEPNYFPSIECDLPDFPWMFTPAAAEADGRLKPWICLVAVRRDRSSIATAGQQPLAVLECPREELPDLAESWAWVHAQIVEGSTRVMDPSSGSEAQQKSLSEFLNRHPERTLSRLLCPRRLDPGTAYHACLVPTFDVGRKAGLGEDITLDDERELKAAWLSAPGAPGSDVIRLPVYYHWEFSTGIEGDFEALARRLVPRKLPATVGLRPMTIGTAEWGMPPLEAGGPGSVLGLEGALRTPDTEPTPWPDAARESFQTALRNILNAPAEQAPPGSQPTIVGPPLYGQWHAKQRTVPEGKAEPHWFRELNLDPRQRAAAGLGTMVVRFEQEPLMASAWEQLARHEQDQDRLKRAQLSEAVGQILDEKHFQPLPVDRFLQITGPIQRALTRTSARQSDSLPARAQPLVSAAFRRMTRRSGPVARRVAVAVRERRRPADATSRALHLQHGLGGPAVQMSAARMQPVRARLLEELNPKSSVRAALKEDLPQAESTDLIQFAPEFPQAMYEPLRDYFEDALLPGMEQVLPNTITLLETNPRFIEAYMAGLNHEMSRELVWRGFPTDQRGTCFRQFWDIRGRVPRPTPEEMAGLKDIAPLTAWPDASHLGENSGAGTAEGQLVLLLKGDLLRRYPRAIIYAAEAAWSADGTRREIGAEERYPLFRAMRLPDVTMLGFPLTEQQARGADRRSDGHAGWFFVLQQQPTEPRFGLDVATIFGGVPVHWRDLTWGHLAADDSALKRIVHVPIGGPLQGTTLDNVPWGRNSAHMAFITRQPPFRVAVHARTWLT